LLEIAHILSGPTVGLFITVLAFNDDAIITRRIREFFHNRGTDKNLADIVERMISGGIALATFLGNVYVLVINCVIVFLVFPATDLKIVALISTLTVAIVTGQAVYLLVIRRYGVLDIGEICPIGQITWDRCLRWEQLVLTVLTVIYFGIGIYLRYS
jgi:hypothetical protein